MKKADLLSLKKTFFKCGLRSEKNSGFKNEDGMVDDLLIQYGLSKWIVDC